MVDAFFGPLPDVEAENPLRRGKFIDVEVYGELFASVGTFDSVTITNATISGTTTINDAPINDATIDNATITNANIDELAYSKIVAGTNPNTLTHSGSFVVTGDLDVSGSISLSGDLTMTGTGVFATASSGARIEIDNSGLGAERLSFYTGATGEYNEAYIETTDLNPIDAATMYLRGPDLGGATNGGYGEFTVTSSDALSKSQFVLNTYAIGTWAADTDVSATAGGSGAATVDLLASADSGNSTVTITAGSNSGTADIVLSADQVQIPDGSVSAPALTFSATGQQDVGIYRSTTDEINFATAGVERAAISNGGFTVGTTTGWARIRYASPAANQPSYTFQGDTGTGMYRPAAAQIGFSTNSGQRLLIDDDVVVVKTGLFRLPVKGSTGDPTATDQGDMYVNSVDNVLKVYEGGSWRTVASW